MNKHVDVMIDLETLGRTAGAVVWEVGMVAFHPATGEEVASSEWLIDVPSAVEVGLEIEQETAQWWQDRGGIRRTGAIDIRAALGDFVETVRELAPYRVWARGAAFDFPILGAALEACELRAPWSYWQACCQRTAWKLAFGDRRPPVANDHTALADCRNQVEQLRECFYRLRGEGVPA